jgi:hypothetical protein
MVRMKNLLAALLLLAWVPASAQEARDARLTKVSGEVSIHTAENPEGIQAEEGMPLEEGDRITTGEGSSAEIGFEDGHLVSLEAASDLTLSRTSRAETELTLTLGGLIAKIQALAASEALRVRTPTAVAAVRGTEFGVDVASAETHVGVFDEGKVEVAGDSGEPQLLVSNQETVIARGGGPLRPYALKRLLRHRREWRAFRGRALVLRREWRALPLEKRRELRRKLMGRMRERRQKVRERIERSQERQRRRREKKQERP